MGIFDGSASASGNQSSSQNSAESHGSGFSDSWSRTYGTEASMLSAAQAAKANEVQQNWMNQEMIYNAMEAQKQRDFNELMANTLYTRSIKNMKEAGINPILAANFGLSGANVNSGATASMSAPSAFMGQTFADQASASHSEWSSESHSSGSSQGSGWSNSESGLATALSNMGEFIGEGIAALSSAKWIDINLGDTKGKTVTDAVKDAIFGDQYSDGTRPKVGGKKTGAETRLEQGKSNGILDKLVGEWDRSMRIVGNSGGHR